ncbi:hypothetical protein F6X68_17420 [Micromonospora sp. AMSO12t]|nr:cellulose binding domain-containing protein [Micromonospora sp. AMSO12t]KAB1151390.1 hypothetical protein F6X68_17420 [Micromonospora sp. AMSO12t]
MRLRGRTILAVGLLAAVALAPLTLTGTAGAAAAPTASFTKVNDWGSGWEGSYRITNSGSSTITSWRLEFDLPAGTTVGTYWDALLTSSGQRHTFTNRSWNGTVAPGASVTFGFVATTNGTNTLPTVTCSGR